MNEDLIAACRKKGTDKAYRKWIQCQPSCISGEHSEWINGEGRNPACHVRRAGKSGIAYKEEYACIPLTHAQHALQHQRGEYAMLDELTCDEWTLESAKAFFDWQVERYRRMWIEGIPVTSGA